MDSFIIESNGGSESIIDSDDAFIAGGIILEYTSVEYILLMSSFSKITISIIIMDIINMINLTFW